MEISEKRRIKFYDLLLWLQRQSDMQEKNLRNNSYKFSRVVSASLAIEFLILFILVLLILK